MVIFITNCDDDLGVGVRALLLCNRGFVLKCIFLAITSRLSLKSTAVCVCMYHPLF